ncbi:MAG: MmgE/PrpD family protein [Haloferacaceae archaeon]
MVTDPDADDGLRVTTDLLAGYAHGFDVDAVDGETRDLAGRFVLDALACAVGAYAADPVKRLRTTYGDRSAETGATLLGTDRTVAPEYAALVNGTMVRYFDYNDTYLSGDSVCHPSDHVPGLLAVAESEGASGADLLAALVLAYEIECRGVDTGLVWDRGFDYVTWGTMSTAAAVGRLMGLDRGTIRDALGIAATSSNALLAARLGDVRMWKGIAHPYVTHSAVQACQMARAGITGPPEAVTGKGGFETAVTGAPIRFAALGGRDGAPFRLARTNLKPYACGYYMMAPIEALLSILGEADVTDPEAIETIEVRTFDQAAQVLDGAEKRARDLTRETADHSLPYTLAVAAVDRDVTPRQYDPDRLSDPAVHDLIDRIDVVVDDDLTAARRANPGELPHVVRVTVDGRTHERRIDAPPGHFCNRMSDERIERKVTDLVRPYLRPDQTDRLVEACRDLAGLDGVDALLDATRV